MYVRELNRREIPDALHIVWEVFAEEVAPLYTPEGIEEFRKVIKYENICAMHEQGEITFFGAFDGEELTGTMAVLSVGHIRLFYVKKSCQGKGAGRALFEAVKDHCERRLGVSRLTVNAAPGAVPKYAHMGMTPSAEEQCEKGMRYVPMEMELSPKAAM